MLDDISFAPGGPGKSGSVRLARRSAWRAARVAFVFGAWLLAAGSGVAQSDSWELVVCADPHVMPMSDRSEDGYENRIASLLADHLGAELRYDWYPFTPDMLNLRLREGHCDVYMGVPDGYEPLVTTVAYYRSPFVFVYRADAGFVIESMDDPILRDLRIGLQDLGIPPHHSLTARGLADNVVATFGANRYAEGADPQGALVSAVVDGAIDVGISWGPPAGYYAARSGAELRVEAVTPEFEMTPTFLSMVVPMAIGVRRGDEALRYRLSIALAERWDDVQAILDEYNVPQSDMPRPTVTGPDQ